MNVGGRPNKDCSAMTGTAAGDGSNRKRPGDTRILELSCVEMVLWAEQIEALELECWRDRPREERQHRAELKALLCKRWKNDDYETLKQVKKMKEIYETTARAAAAW